MINNEDHSPYPLGKNLNENSRSSEIFFVTSSFVVALIFYGIIDLYWVTALGIGVVFYSLVWYIESLGKGSAILQIMLFIAVVQWILGPIIAYHFGGETYKHRMYVSEQVYMDYAVPSVVSLMLGLRLISARVNLMSISAHIRSSAPENRYIFLLLLAGLSIEFFVPFFPTSLLFVAYVIAQFKYIALLYLIVTEHRYRWFVTAIVFLVSLVSSAEQGLFHGLILWSALIFSYICITLRLSRIGKLSVLAIGIILLISLQIVKGDYRELIASGSHSNQPKIGLLVDMLLGSVDYLNVKPSDPNSNFDIGSLNARLNQGWIVSAVMNHVPKHEDFVEGETVLSAFRDSLVPRFLVEKRRVRVSENFQRFTGLEINQQTSMGISILAEAYVNFGVLGGVIFMLFWGILIALIMKIIVDVSFNHPTIILWAPLIFLQMVKAETELVVVMNHGVKTSIVIAVFYLTAKKILGWRI